MIAMRQEYMVTDDDLRTLRPIINSLVEEDKLMIVEDYEIKIFYDGYSGRVTVLRKSSE